MAKTFRYQHFHTSTAGRVPSASTLNDAEIALNIAAGQEKMFVKNSAGNVVEFIPEPQIDAKINALNKAASAEDGKVVTTVTEVSGVVSETKSLIKDVKLVDYANDGSTHTGSITTADTVESALNKLENVIGSNLITNADGSITVTAPTGTATTTDIKVKIKSGEKVIKLDSNGGGIYTDIKISALTAEEIAELQDENVKEAYKLLDSDANQLGDVIKIYKDSSLYSVYLGHVDDTLSDDEDPTSVVSGTGATALCFIYQLADGTYSLVPVDVSKFLEETEFSDGLQVIDHVVSVKKDSTSEKVITVYDPTGNTEADVITVSSNGVKIANIQAAIDAKIGTLDVSDSAESGKYVSQVSETDGKISVSRLNVSEAPLNNYASGTTNAAVAATDTVNQAIGKLENQVKAATSKVEKDSNANHLTLSSATSVSDGSVTYTIGETDIASDSDLRTEIAARKAVDGQTGQTYAANVSSNYITGATSLNDADVKLDAALKAEETARINAVSGLQIEINSIETGAGLNADGTYAANANANYISGATSLNNADVKLDAALKAEVDRANSAEQTIESGLTQLSGSVIELSGAVKSTVESLDYTDTAVTNQWVTKVDEVDGVIAPSRDYISVTQLSTLGTLDFEEAENGDIILSAGTF